MACRHGRSSYVTEVPSLCLTLAAIRLSVICAPRIISTCKSPFVDCRRRCSYCTGKASSKVQSPGTWCSHRRISIHGIKNVVHSLFQKSPLGSSTELSFKSKSCLDFVSVQNAIDNSVSPSRSKMSRPPPFPQSETWEIIEILPSFSETILDSPFSNPTPMTNPISKLHRLFTKAFKLRNESRPSPPLDEVFEIEGHPVPPLTFAHAVLELPPWFEDSEKTTPSAFIPILEGTKAGFYGHKRIAKSTSAFITSTFGCPDESLLSIVFLQPSLPYFIASIIHRTLVPYSVVTATFVLLRRYQSQLLPKFNSSKLTAHILFISSYIFAVREHWPKKEKVFDNEYWSQISNFAAKDIQLMLDHFYDKLKGNVGVYSSRFRRTIYWK